MADTSETILAEIKELKSWLYGADGHEGDVTEIKASLKNHDKRIRRIELIVAALVVAIGGSIGLVNLLGG